MLPPVNTRIDERHAAEWSTWRSVNDVRIEHREGRFRHDVEAEGRLRLESLLLRRPESRKLVVYLHGSLDRTKYELPRFERLESLQSLDANVLFLADPTLRLAPALRIGWFIGTRDDDVTEHYAALIRKVADDVNAEQLVVAGASSGGFAAIALAPRLPEALCIAWSPQVSVERFGKNWAEALRRAAFPDVADFQSLKNDPCILGRIDLADLYRRAKGGRLWYVQNSGDESHNVAQYEPFKAEKDPRVTFVPEHHCNGHNPPTVSRVVAWLNRALEAPEKDPRDFALVMSV